MSIHGQLKPEPSLSRSKSWGGLLIPRNSSLFNAEINGSTTSLSLGNNYSTNRSQKLIQNLSATWSGKAPKIPRPERTFAIFNSIIKGLKECLWITEKDITKLKQGVQDLSNNSPQQLRAAERYLKRLEFQLLKIEEFREKYEIQFKMRDGVRTMQHAYVLNSGKDSTLHNVRSGLQECSDALCSLETELERNMGSLNFYLKGIQGFARICPGDVYDICLKYGDQKWRGRGKILKDNKQEWDSYQFMFKALLEEVLFIKASEVRSLSKSIPLGNKYCETRDLFSSHPQLMTINLTPSSSLKLNLIVTWNPLHGCLDDASPKPTSSLLSLFGTPSLKRKESFTSFLPPGVEVRPKFSSIYNSPDIVPAEGSGGDSSECCSLDMDDSDGENLMEVLQTLATNLEDLQGQHPQLEELEKEINYLLDIFGVERSRRSSTDSSMSQSVQNALGCFDFLNAASDGDEELPEPRSLRTKEVESAAKTSDSGIASLSRKVHKQAPHASCSGWDQLDLALYTHLLYCQRLLENVGLFGPLKYQETSSLEKLSQQTVALKTLGELVKPYKELGRTVSGIDLVPSEEIQHLWSYVSGGGELLCLPVKQILGPLTHHPGCVGSDIAQLLLAQVLDVVKCAPDDIVTSLQLELNLEGQSLQEIFNNFTHQVKLKQALTSGEVYLVKSTLNSLEKPQKESLWIVGPLVTHRNPALAKLAENYLKKLIRQPGMKQKMFQYFMEGLESENENLRRASCKILSFIQIHTSIEALAYLSYADENSQVQQEARAALFLFGEAGRKAFQQCQLNSRHRYVEPVKF